MFTLKQVKGLLSYKYYFANLIKCNLRHETTSGAKVLYPLKTRALLKIKGDDTSEFLQGLITNDMRHFDTGSQSIYAMFLNNKGRVMYDTLIHKWDTDKSFMIECDRKLIQSLSKHLKMFKLRRNINIEDMSEVYKLWAITLPTTTESGNNSKITVFKDPRLTDLGHRIIASKDTKDMEVAQHFGTDISVESNEDGYRHLRYMLGVSEGADDLPPASSFPLEANCDYLHGVSFHKGCYIGQEVTARVHHTGVVRKRIMPLKFAEPVCESIEHDTNIVAANNTKTNLGKIKGIVKNYGLGLIRIKEALEAKTVKVNNFTAEPFRPLWWPLEAPKEISKSSENVKA